MRISHDVAFLTPEQMAAKLGISVRKLQQMVRDGVAPDHTRIGRKVRFLIQKEGRHD
jgi:excisionase family DNA binding protein